MSTKKKITLSVVTALGVLALLVGATWAWFTDTERADARFEAGILDITIGENEGLLFQNLRPMASEEAFLAEINSDIDYPEAGFAEPTVYVQEFAITNAGTLPVKIQLQLVEGDIPEDCQIDNIIDNGVGGVMVGDPALVDCDNSLMEALRLVLLIKNADGEYEKVNSFTAADFLQILEDEEGNDLILNAGETGSTYAIGAYLDAEAGNAFQAKHYHAVLNVAAAQTDEGAEFGPENP